MVPTLGTISSMFDFNEVGGITTIFQKKIVMRGECMLVLLEFGNSGGAELDGERLCTCTWHCISMPCGRC